MKERPIIFSAPMVQAILQGRKTKTRRILKPQPLEGVMPDSSWIRPFEAGERLWVRENFAWYPLEEDPSCVIYRADHGNNPAPPEFAPWKPSIHMPRWASRITLEVERVRMQRLQDISEQDAIAEGIEPVESFFGCPCWRDYGQNSEDTVFPDDPIGSFQSLWETIHGPKSWDANPWVWVIDFKNVNP